MKSVLKLTAILIIYAIINKHFSMNMNCEVKYELTYQYDFDARRLLVFFIIVEICCKL